MKSGFYIVGLFAALFLTACGGENKTSANNDPALQRQADIARATLQEKADALARQASVSPPPPADDKKK
jgi:hypothetical protein